MSWTFPSTVAGILAAHTAWTPLRLILEITENVFIEDIERATTVLADLKELGIRVAVDDFGTGYSSLAYLQRLPIDMVKIDQSFIAGIGLAESGTTIVSAVTDLAHALGFTVTAEGVETESPKRRGHRARMRVRPGLSLRSTNVSNRPRHYRGRHRQDRLRARGALGRGRGRGVQTASRSSRQQRPCSSSMASDLLFCGSGGRI